MHRDLIMHPEILDEEILPPVFITSLPRTGSTKLHRILGASGDFHAMKFWHAYQFAPLADTATGENDPRIGMAENFLAGLQQRAPKYLEQHPMLLTTEEDNIRSMPASTAFTSTLPS